MDLLRVEHICETYGGGEAAVHVLKVSDGVLTDLGAPGMKSYLSLIPISARVRRQNRMTLLCIIFAVFLVTGIFSMAELFIQSETANARETGGNWHINLENISEEKATSIAQRPDVAACSWFGIQRPGICHQQHPDPAVRRRGAFSDRYHDLFPGGRQSGERRGPMPRCCWEWMWGIP